MVPFLGGGRRPAQPLSAEIEFRQFIGYMARHFADVKKAQDAEKPEPDFDLSGLENLLMSGFQNRTKEEFTRDSAFADHWIISKHHLKKGKWKKALTFAKAHEALIFGYFKGKALPKSSVSTLGGVDVVKWEKLLENKQIDYWNTKRTLADYASENRKVILALKGVDLVKNSGKVVMVGDKTLYVANVDIDGEPYMVFSFVNQLKVPSWHSRVLETIKGYY